VLRQLKLQLSHVLLHQQLEQLQAAAHGGGASSQRGCGQWPQRGQVAAALLQRPILAL
jgi:hypothetical protein